MAKYRRLAVDELEELQKEFIGFLLSNDVSIEEWEQLKITEPNKAEGLLDIFSDIVFDNILSKVEYLEHKQAKMVRAYKFLDDKVLMMGIVHRGDSALDFRNTDIPVNEMLQQVQASGSIIELFSGEKKYKFLKETEIFNIMEEGALISKDPTLFDTLSSLK